MCREQRLGVQPCRGGETRLKCMVSRTRIAQPTSEESLYEPGGHSPRYQYRGGLSRPLAAEKRGRGSATRRGSRCDDLSIIGRDFQTSEEPIGFISSGDYATAGARPVRVSEDCSACSSVRRS